MALGIPAWLLRPFTVGQSKSSLPKDHPGNSSNQDGHISSLLLGLLLVSITLSALFSEPMSQDQTKPIGKGDVEVCITFLLVPGCLVMVRYIYLHGRDSAPEVSKKIHVGTCEKDCFIRIYIKRKLPIIGLTVFYLGGLFRDTFIMLACIDCFTAFSSCDLILKTLASLIYHIVKPVFMGIITVFAIVYSSTHLTKSVGNRYGVMIIGTGVLSLCFNSFVQEYKVQHSKEYQGRNSSNCSDDSEKVNQCLNKTTELYSIARRFSSFSGTLNVEFTIIAMEWLLRMYWGMVSVRTYDEESNITEPLPSLVRNQISTSQQEHSLSESETMNSVNSNEQNDLAIQSNEYTPLLQNKIKSPRSGFKVPLGIILSAITNIPMFVFGIMIFRQIVEGYHAFLTLYRVTAILTCFLGFWASKSFSFERNFQFYSSFEILALICSIGCFCFDTLVFISAISLWTGSSRLDGKPLPKSAHITAVFVEKLINIIHIFLQSSFIMHVRQLEPQTSPTFNSKVLRECLIFLAICNLITWGMNSFVIAKTGNAEEVIVYYYGQDSWQHIVEFTTPSSNFYRFNCFLFLLKLYVTHTIRSNK